ncbi:hypothetical protein Scep_022155 [Stephania cephalantha]|uniref:Uncharacterized protein n=1 Tax=Stephania cephalantha TaxID=152367 RepID=A0AAP0F5U7_9MAGN
MSVDGGMKRIHVGWTTTWISYGFPTLGASAGNVGSIRFWELDHRKLEGRLWFFLVTGIRVTIIEMVSNKAERVTEVSFYLDDGTGRIDCHRWMNESIDSKEMEEIR